jgi:hypothetical protein
LQTHDRSPKDADALAARYYAAVANFTAYGRPLIDPIVAGGPHFADQLVAFCERNRSNSFQRLMADLIRAIVLH